MLLMMLQWMPLYQLASLISHEFSKSSWNELVGLHHTYSQMDCGFSLWKVSSACEMENVMLHWRKGHWAGSHKNLVRYLNEILAHSIHIQRHSSYLAVCRKAILGTYPFLSTNSPNVFSLLALWRLSDEPIMLTGFIMAVMLLVTSSLLTNKLIF